MSGKCKERPILFNSEMVNAILSGRKTQTRRIIANAGADNCIPLQKRTKTKDGIYTHVMDAPAYGLCPLGKPGDQLWVRETFALLGNEDGVCIDWQGNMVKGDEELAARIYKASCEQKRGDYGLYSIPDSAYWKPDTTNEKYEGTWRPSIHMPRWASRIDLLITGIRVERLQDISDLDCCDEGYDGPAVTADNQWPSINWYERLWDSIYGKKEGENWQANPWVWVINFEKID